MSSKHLLRPWGAMVGLMVAIGCGGSGGKTSASATTLTASPTTAYPGSLVVLTATVSPSAATGSVTFNDGNTSLGTASLSGGTATLPTHFNSTGSYTLTATYAGDSTYASSTSSAVSEAVEASSYSLDLSSYSSSSGSMTVTTDASHDVAYTLYQNVVYAANPVDKTYESMNIYIPTSVDGASVSGKPILLEIGVGGYMSSSTWVSSDGSGSSNSGTGGSPPSGSPPSGGAPSGGAPSGGPGGGGAPGTNGQHALAKGYVVVEVGCRGRDNESNGTYYGKAPAAIVDLKAAVRFLRYNRNAGTFTGDVEHIIDSGGSAGGALASLLGASGNSSLYHSYLAAIGAADAKDDIFAVGAWSPITNLDHADMAYEWEYGTLSSGGSAVNSTVSGQLQTDFSSYQDGLALTDKRGSYGSITHSNIDDYVLTQYLEPSAASYLESLPSSTLSSYLTANSWITWESTNHKATFTLTDYLSHVGSRAKSVPAFDSFFDLSSSTSGVNTSVTAEVSEFGSSTTSARHFTNFSSEYVDSIAITSDMQTIVNMMNPMYFIMMALSSGDKSGVARHWYIRDGSLATDTSAIVIIDLATSLDDLLGKDYVNAAEDWDQGHNVNVDPGGFSTWVGSSVAAD